MASEVSGAGSGPSPAAVPPPSPSAAGAPAAGTAAQTSPAASSAPTSPTAAPAGALAAPDQFTQGPSRIDDTAAMTQAVWDACNKPETPADNQAKQLEFQQVIDKALEGGRKLAELGKQVFDAGLSWFNRITGNTSVTDEMKNTADTVAKTLQPHLPTPADRGLQSSLLKNDKALQAVANGEAILQKYDGVASPTPGTAAVQDGLRKLGYSIDDSNGQYRGYFGQHTENAVKTFQREHSCVVDGIVGKQTLAALDHALVAQAQKPQIGPPKPPVTGPMPASDPKTKGWKPEVESPPPPAKQAKIIDGKHCWSGNLADIARDIADADCPWNHPANRSAENLDKLIDYFNPGDPNNKRYQPTDNSTFCNIFVHDVTRAMGVSVPHWENGRELDANDNIEWIKDPKRGGAHGWTKVDSPEKAQELANQGYPVVAAYHNRNPKVDSGIGHVAMVRPGEGKTVGGKFYPSSAQAGSVTFNDETILEGFGSRRQVEYYVNTRSTPYTPSATEAGKTKPNELQSSLKNDPHLQEVADGKRLLKRSPVEDGPVPGVATMQDALRKLGYPIDDVNGKYRGYFGQNTEAAVKAFQRDHGCAVDGIVGQQTIKALDAALAKVEKPFIGPMPPPAKGQGQLATDTANVVNKMKADPKNTDNFARMLEDADFGFKDKNGKEFMSASDIQKFFNEHPGGPLDTYKDANGKSAAHMIYDACKKHDVNPMLLLARLQTEQSLITSDHGSIDWAFGVGAYDSGEWAQQFKGFANQCNGAAEAMRRLFNEGREKKAAGRSLEWTVNRGKDKVRCQNAATYALIRYTPHTIDTALNVIGGGNYLFMNCFHNFFGKK